MNVAQLAAPIYLTRSPCGIVIPDPERHTLAAVNHLVSVVARAHVNLNKHLERRQAAIVKADPPPRDNNYRPGTVPKSFGGMLNKTIVATIALEAFRKRAGRTIATHHLHKSTGVNNGRISYAA